MFLWDSNILRHFAEGNEQILRRAQQVGWEQIALPCVVVAEVLRGRAEFGLKGEPNQLVNAYEYFANTIESLAQFQIEPFTEAAAGELAALKRKHLSRKRYPDLQIAAITLAGGHCLVTRNLKHFQDLLPANQLENWME